MKPFRKSEKSLNQIQKIAETVIPKKNSKKQINGKYFKK